MSSGILHKELDRRKIYDRALGAFKREKKTTLCNILYFIFTLSFTVFFV